MDSGLFLLFLSVLIVGVALLAVIAIHKQPSRLLNQTKYREKWLTISNSIDTAHPSSAAMAVLNADRLLDEALRERGIAGDTLGERMKNCKELFSDRNGVWTAHKLRNRIAHEETSVSVKQANAALKCFKQALKDIGAL